MLKVSKLALHTACVYIHNILVLKALYIYMYIESNLNTLSRKETMSSGKALFSLSLHKSDCDLLQCVAYNTHNIPGSIV